MSKKAKAESKKKRLAKKRARREANKRKYQELAQLGMNTKSKRFRKNSKSRHNILVDHPDGRCGNLACNKCHPEYP